MNGAGQDESGLQIFSVSDLTLAIKMLLESEIGRVSVEGEISNYRKQASGHQYFVLKDDDAQIACVLFKGRAQAIRVQKLEDGQQVVLEGELGVYTARGQYQIIVDRIRRKGEGALFAKFEELKRKLQSEGLFDPATKSPLPIYPNSICLVTSPSGAAVRDMIDVLTRRAPWVDIHVFPVRVQGKGAAGEIAEAIDLLNTWNEEGTYTPDLIIVGRGGGSIEDLWEFNEEVLARTIFSSRIPIVSAVGHETDFTIADFVADVRAPTPSAAAEIVVPDKVDLIGQLQRLQSAMKNIFRARTDLLAEKLRAYRPATFRREIVRYIEQKEQQLDDHALTCARAAADRMDEYGQYLDTLKNGLALMNPEKSISLIRQQLMHAGNAMTVEAKRHFKEKEKELKGLQRALLLLGPDQTLQRGFTLTMTGDGDIIREAKSLKPGQSIRTRFHDGESQSIVAG